MAETDTAVAVEEAVEESKPSPTTAIKAVRKFLDANLKPVKKEQDFNFLVPTTVEECIEQLNGQLLEKLQAACLRVFRKASKLKIEIPAESYRPRSLGILELSLSHRLKRWQLVPKADQRDAKRAELVELVLGEAKLKTMLRALSDNMDDDDEDEPGEE